MHKRQGVFLVIIIGGIIAAGYLSVSILRQVQQLLVEPPKVSVISGVIVKGTPISLPEATVSHDNGFSAGQTLFAENCTPCHGVSGEGSTIAPPLNVPDVRQTDRDVLQNTITFGRSGTAMPAWGIKAGGTLGAEQIGELVSLIRAGAWQSAPPVAAAGDNFSSIPPQALSLYSQNCAACHGSTGKGSGIAPPLNSPALRARMTAEARESTIRNGRRGTRMPAGAWFSVRIIYLRW